MRRARRGAVLTGCEGGPGYAGGGHALAGEPAECRCRQRGLLAARNQTVPRGHAALAAGPYPIAGLGGRVSAIGARPGGCAVMQTRPVDGGPARADGRPVVVGHHALQPFCVRRGAGVSGLAPHEGRGSGTGADTYRVDRLRRSPRSAEPRSAQPGPTGQPTAMPAGATAMGSAGDGATGSTM